MVPAGDELSAGDLITQPELAHTLAAIDQHGSDVAYDGGVAEAIAAATDDVTSDDLAGYAVRHSEPLSVPWGGRVLPLPPPPAGGVTLAGMLLRVERYADGRLLEPSYTGDGTRVETIRPSRSTTTRWVVSDSPSTTSVSIGRWGNTSSIGYVGTPSSVMTNTLTSLWGSGRYELGFFLNDQLGIFPGQRANQPPEAGKRAVSSTTPTIVFDDRGRPVLGLGSPGGSRIPTVVAQVLTRWAAHDQPLADAVAAPRFHLDGDVLRLEHPHTPLADQLRARGYAAVDGPAWSYYFGSVQALAIDHDAGRLRGAADPRRAGAWERATP